MEEVYHDYLQRALVTSLGRMLPVCVLACLRPLARNAQASAAHRQAWLRLQVLTHNLLELLKAAVLPAEYRKARPKRLRFAVFTQWGRVVRHAHKTVVRITTLALEALIGPGRR